MFRFLGSSLLCVGFIAACGCESKKPEVAAPSGATSADVQHEVDEALDKAGDFSQEKKEAFVADLEARLAKLDADVDKLREQGGDLNDHAKLRRQRKLTALEFKREAVRTRLTEVGAASGEAWKDFREGVKSAWNDLEKAFREAAKEQ